MNESVKFRFGIDNILDKNTPIIPNAPAGIGNGNTFPGSFDYLGRYVFASVTYSL